MIQRNSLNQLTLREALENAKIMAEDVVDRRRRKSLVVPAPTADPPAADLDESAPKQWRKTIMMTTTPPPPPATGPIGDARKQRRQSIMTPLPSGLAAGGGEGPRQRRRSVMVLPTALANPSQSWVVAVPRQRRTSSLFSRSNVTATPLDASEKSQLSQSTASRPQRRRRSSLFSFPAAVMGSMSSWSDDSSDTSSNSDSAPGQRRRRTSTMFSIAASLTDFSDHSSALLGGSTRTATTPRRRGTTPARSRSMPLRRKPSVVTSNVRFQRIIEATAVTQDDMKHLLNQDGGLEALKKALKGSGVVTNSSIGQGIHFFVRECTMDWTERRSF